MNVLHFESLTTCKFQYYWEKAELFNKFYLFLYGNYNTSETHQLSKRIALRIETP